MGPKKNQQSAVSRQVSSTGSSSTLRTIVLILLPLFSAAGFYGTWILSSGNGTVAVLEALSKQSAPFLPGTTERLLTKYTGVAAIDKQLIILVTFFSPVLDDKNAALKVSSIFGLGQFGAAYTVMMLESLRAGNSGRIVSYVGTFGFILQNITFVVTVPWWLFIHILTSPTSSPFPGKHSSSVLRISKVDIFLLPLSTTLGYIVPSVLMALPVTSTILHQQLIALWQPFPVWVVIIQTVLRSVINLFTGSEETATKAQEATPYTKSASYVYKFLIGICAVTHLSALAVTLLPASVFSEAPPFIQALSNVDFASVYIPYFPTPTHQIGSFADGVHAFLQWDMYLGALAMLLWGVYVHQIAPSKSSVTGLVGKVGFWTLVAGPVGALVALLWERDEAVKGKVKEGI